MSSVKFQGRSAPGAQRAAPDTRSPLATVRFSDGSLETCCPAGPRRHAIDPQQDERTDDGQYNAPQRKAVQSGTRDHVPEETSQERTHDTDENRHNDSTRVVTRHDRLGDRTRDQAQYDPRDDTHIPASVKGGDVERL